jgi:hypothetical protein
MTNTGWAYCPNERPQLKLAISMFNCFLVTLGKRYEVKDQNGESVRDLTQAATA